MTEPRGLLIVDKGPGLTSHDVVGLARRVLGTRAVGHTGTLDPLATGVLVLMVGEATKLAAYLTAADKVYETTLRLGVATDTLDAGGAVTGTAPVPSLDRELLERAVAQFVGEISQRVPDVSAVKVAGQRLHRAARAGRAVEAPTRTVVAHAIEVTGLGQAEVDLRVHCGKGFYVRSLGRDLASALGTVGHLSALRRVRNGCFDVAQAIDSGQLREAKADPTLAEQVRGGLMPWPEACRLLPHLVLSAPGVARARVGQAIPVDDVLTRAQGQLASEIYVAFDEAGGPVGLVSEADQALRVVRGFSCASGQGAQRAGD